MIHLLYQFLKTTDPGALERFLETNLIPGLKQAHGLRALESSQGDLMSAGGPPPYSRVAEATFDSLEDLFAYVQSPTGLATQEFLEGERALIIFYEIASL